MVTIGSQASGDTGLKIWISGLRAPLTVRDSPDAMPIGTATRVGVLVILYLLNPPPTGVDVA